MTSEARLVVNWVVIGTGEFLIVVSCLFSWIKGSAAERLGAAVFGLAALGTLLAEMITHQATPVVGELLLDTTEAIAFLALAIRYNNLWVGGAMMLKGIQLAIHATHLTDGEDPMLLGFNLYAASLNLLSDLMALSLIAATFAAMRRRREAQEGASAPGHIPALVRRAQESLAH